MKTIKGPAVFLAQFVDSKAPFNSLDGMCKWAADLGYKGIQIPRNFYSPMYTGAGIDRIPDYRSTLLWEPEVAFDLQGKSSIEFFTSDFDGEFKIEVFGITGDGEILFETKDFTVKGKNNKQ